MPRPHARAGRSGAPAARSHGRLLALALALPLACNGDDGGTEGPGDESSGTAGEGPPQPAFAEPASSQLSLVATRTDDLVLTVQGVEPGRTELLIDETSLGPLDEDAIAGRIDGDALVLRLRGSMISGNHRMQLRNGGTSLILDSEVVEVTIMSELEIVPTVSPLVPTGLAAARLLVMGEGDDALLVVLATDGPEPRLLLVPRGESGWDVAGARTVAAAGLSLAPGERSLPAAALRRDRGDGEAGRVRVAFRVGAPGERIDLLDLAWDQAAPELPPSASLTAAAAVGDGAVEWAELGRPWLVADLLVAELWAPVDVESPRPGDRALVWSRVHDDESLDAPQRVFVRPDLVDLDRLGPAIDRAAAEVGMPGLVSIRADQQEPLVLELDPTGGLRPRPTVIAAGDRTFGFVDVPLASVVGAFGSRTVAGLTATASGRMRVALLDDLGEAGEQDTSLGDEDVPTLDQATGELAPGSVAGITVFLVPYGPELPVHAIHHAGIRVEVTPLPDLRCDAVALAPSPDDDGVLPLACAREGELFVGSLSAMPPG